MFSSTSYWTVTEMTKIEKAVSWAIQTANDNSHGYSQADRWGPDYDCSSFVIEAYEQAGVPVRQGGATYTGNMRGAFLGCGFTDVTNLINLSNGSGLQPGDVLLNYSAHTCIAIGNGKVANCRTDEGHPQAGDQSGNEIRLQSYWNYPWNCVLRYTDNNAQAAPDPVIAYAESLTGKPVASDLQPNLQEVATKEENHGWKPGTLKRNSKYSINNVILQGLLTARGFNCGSVDGYFGPLTEVAVNHAKRYYSLERNGVCDYALWIKLLLIER